VSVADRGEPEVSCSEWHGDGTAGEHDVSAPRGSGTSLPRWVRPVQGDTSLVGKRPKAAWQPQPVPLVQHSGDAAQE
jgi:hypothetical protein